MTTPFQIELEEVVEGSGNDRTQNKAAAALDHPLQGHYEPHGRAGTAAWRRRFGGGEIRFSGCISTGPGLGHLGWREIPAAVGGNCGCHPPPATEVSVRGRVLCRGEFWSVALVARED